MTSGRCFWLFWFILAIAVLGAGATNAQVLIPTEITITSSPNPSQVDQEVTFTATVRSSSGTPGGEVVFDNDNNYHTVALSNGVATFSKAFTRRGPNYVSAFYLGTSTYAESWTPSVMQIVTGLPSTTIISTSANPVFAGQSAMLRATVTGPSATPEGRVMFRFLDYVDGMESEPWVRLVNGVATIPVRYPVSGSYRVDARYMGSDRHFEGASEVLVQQVEQNPTVSVVSSSRNPSTEGEEVTFTATVTSPAGVPEGRMFFSFGSFGATTVDLVNGRASATTRYEFTGDNPVYVRYTGSNTFRESQSSQVVQTVVPAVQPNDHFVNGTVINRPGTFTGSTYGATREAGEPVHASTSSARESIWWRYRPTVSGPITIDTVGSPINTVLAVYTGSSVNALTIVAENRNVSAFNNISQVTFHAIAGTTYNIAVAPSIGIRGNVRLNVFGGDGAPLVNILSAVAPIARNVPYRNTVTAFATILNASTKPATSCFADAPSGQYDVLLSYRSFDVQSGEFGELNEPLNVPAGGRQDLFLTMRKQSGGVTEVPIVFDCTNTAAAPSIAGLNTFMFIGSDLVSTADVIGGLATLSNDGIVNVPLGGTGAFAIAAQNIGGDGASVRVELAGSTVGVPMQSLPVTMRICQTNPSTGACLSPPIEGSVFIPRLEPGQVATLAAFLTSNGTQIPFDPASKRLFVRFWNSNSSSDLLGIASVAVRTSSGAP